MLMERLVEWRKTEDNREVINARPPDLIVPISYGAVDAEHLALGTEQNLRGALSLMQHFPDAKMIFSSCSYLFEYAGFHEDVLRWRMVQDADLVHRVFRARYMINSVDEGMAIKETVLECHIPRKRIAVITGPMHSKSARLIWEYVFPGSKVMIVCTDWRKEFQPDHPAPMVRTAWRWFFVNETRLKLLQILGPETIKNRHHRVSRAAR